MADPIPSQAGQVQTVPEKPDVLVSSTSIAGYSYDDKAYSLTIWYKGKKPAIFRYFLVYPPMMASIFNAGGSIGAKARQMLSGVYKIRLR